ncbi:MAG: type IV conjugative transfer system protein TraL [Gammaproteobacteria bacterium]|nr:type IV conjugative transfer system protein TraL [Gammaproteobacteria bacterium]
MDNSFYKIPQYLDEPDKIFFFYTDELLLGCVAFFVFYFLFNWIIGCVALVVSIRLKHKYRKTRWANIFQSFIYWHFPSKRNKNIPPSFIREYL